MKLGDLALEAPARVSVRVSNAMTRLLVRGTLRGTVTVPCSRCLEPARIFVEAEIDEEFLPASSPEVSEEGESPWSDLNVFGDEDNEIDLTEILRQNAIAAIPIQPLCREDCGGLCPNCGENRNQVTCQCVEMAIDPRLESLLAYQQRLKE